MSPEPRSGPTDRSRSWSTPSVRIVSDQATGPAWVPGPTAQQSLASQRVNAWIVIALFIVSSALSIFDLYLLMSGLR
jgi:hypothetical protein